MTLKESAPQMQNAKIIETHQKHTSIDRQERQQGRESSPVFDAFNDFEDKISQEELHRYGYKRILVNQRGHDRIGLISKTGLDSDESGQKIQKMQEKPGNAKKQEIRCWLPPDGRYHRSHSPFGVSEIC